MSAQDRPVWWVGVVLRGVSKRGVIEDTSLEVSFKAPDRFQSGFVLTETREEALAKFREFMPESDNARVVKSMTGRMTDVEEREEHPHE